MKVLSIFNPLGLCCCRCCLSRNWTMQMVRSAQEVPAPSRRTACHHVLPSRRSTPCRSETGPTVLPCRMEQVTTSEQLLLWMELSFFKQWSLSSSLWVIVFRVCCLSGYDGRKLCICAGSGTNWFLLNALIVISFRCLSFTVRVTMCA